MCYNGPRLFLLSCIATRQGFSEPDKEVLMNTVKDDSVVVPQADQMALAAAKAHFLELTEESRGKMRKEGGFSWPYLAGVLVCCIGAIGGAIGSFVSLLSVLFFYGTWGMLAKWAIGSFLVTMAGGAIISSVDLRVQRMLADQYLAELLEDSGAVKMAYDKWCKDILQASVWDTETNLRKRLAIFAKERAWFAAEVSRLNVGDSLVEKYEAYIAKIDETSSGVEKILKDLSLVGDRLRERLVHAVRLRIAEYVRSRAQSSLAGTTESIDLQAHLMASAQESEELVSREMEAAEACSAKALELAEFLEMCRGESLISVGAGVVDAGCVSVGGPMEDDARDRPSQKTRV